MSTDLFQMFDNINSEFNPVLLEKSGMMKIQIKNQKDENASLKKDMDLLNQEIKLTFEDIIKLGGRLSELEKIFGYDISGKKNEDGFNETGFSSLN